AMLCRPDLAQARLNLANRDLDVVRTKNGLLPALDAFASYGRQSEGTGRGDWARDWDDATYDRFQLGLSFDIAPGLRAERARFERARLRQDQTEAALRNLEQLIETEVRKTAVEVERQWESIEAARQEVLRREEELRIETDQFRLGRSTNLDVLQVQRNFVQARVAEATARVRSMEAVAALYRTEGTLLPRRGISLESDRRSPL
ncbi:MAG TPA: TolC family protein, partial [Candidatus Hydrogenedentes bacterium]|nr:TolC family protein [Candidatus Hydrogenedentota bacterium]